MIQWTSARLAGTGLRRQRLNAHAPHQRDDVAPTDLHAIRFSRLRSMRAPMKGCSRCNASMRRTNASSAPQVALDKWYIVPRLIRCRLQTYNCVGSPCRATALSAAPALLYA